MSNPTRRSTKKKFEKWALDLAMRSSVIKPQQRQFPQIGRGECPVAADCEVWRGGPALKDNMCSPPF